MCAATAAYQGYRVLVLDHANKAGKKILMSGGGRCNFTNLNTTPEHFVSANPHFCKSALKRYSPWHFVELVERHGIEHVEKAAGQLFCAESSKDILGILLTECGWAGAEISLENRHQTGGTGRGWVCAFHHGWGRNVPQTGGGLRGAVDSHHGGLGLRLSAC